MRRGSSQEYPNEKLLIEYSSLKKNLIIVTPAKAAKLQFQFHLG